MAKSFIKRPDGTTIEIDGSAAEIKSILEVYSGKDTSKPKERRGAKDSAVIKSSDIDSSQDVVVQVVQQIRSSDDSEKIEANILDQSSQVDRVLLPLYIANKYIGGGLKMTSGDIYNILKQLGVKMSLPNISRTLAKTGSKYVIPHGLRKKGESNKYTLALKGQKYIESLLN